MSSGIFWFGCKVPVPARDQKIRSDSGSCQNFSSGLSSSLKTQNREFSTPNPIENFWKLPYPKPGPTSFSTRHIPGLLFFSKNILLKFSNTNNKSTTKTNKPRRRRTINFIVFRNYRS
ncbi:unnamed protein product [Meloidogyne enterolobii]|uniref:Uncharacterized protein n=1 Tax=Meloidogyne enterolobii TaxID=390850 RepID=A0ACB0YZH2_MELEN